MAFWTEKALLTTVLVISTTAVAGCNSQSGGGSSLGAQYAAALKIAGAEARGQRLIDIAKRQLAAGDQAGADQSLATAAQAAKEIEKPLGRAKLLTRIAYEQGKQGERGEAKDLLKQAKKAYMQVELIEARIPVVANAAVTYGRFLGQTAVAEADLKEAESWIDAIPNEKDQVAARIDISIAHHRISPGAAESVRLMSEADEQARGLEDKRNRTDGLIHVASTYHKMEQHELSESAISEAKQTVNEISEDLSRAYALTSLAVTVKQLGDKKTAKELIQQAKTLAEKVDPSLRDNLKEDIRKARAKI